jgi:hypothetical protein
MVRKWAFAVVTALSMSGAGGGVASLASGCGGCLWVNSSAIDVRPSSPCLEVAIERAELDSGCARVVLTGRNRCDAPFVVEPPPGGGGAPTTIAPGDAFAVPLSYDYPVYDSQADAYRFDVRCSLGGRPLSLEFSTWL